MLSYSIPKLWLSDEHHIGSLSFSPLALTVLVYRTNCVVLPPEISKTAESQTGNAEKVLHAPYCGKLHRDSAFTLLSFEVDVAFTISDELSENLQVQCILIVSTMDEPVDTAEEGMVDRVVAVNTAVVLYMDAERSEFAVLPEVKATGNLEIASVRRHILIFGVLLVVIVVDEEESVTPFVSVETLESSGNVLTVTTEVLKDLEVSLRFRHLRERHECYNCSKKGFF